MVLLHRSVQQHNVRELLQRHSNKLFKCGQSRPDLWRPRPGQGSELRNNGDNGVIVLLSGQGGTAPSPDPVGVNNGDLSFANYYFKQGYVVVQLAWDTDWEYVANPLPPSTYGNIQYASCRPATFLYYVFNNLYLPIQSGQNGNSKAGMCEHGFSAGSGAIAYTLAYYGPPSGQSWWVDNVELLSGPVFSDIRQGCEEPAPQNVTVCGQNSANQWGCHIGTGGTWSLPPTYDPPSNGWVQGWTGDYCTNPAGTSSTSDTRWWKQSIVDDGTNNPVFSYTSTAMSGWLCRSVLNIDDDNCSTNYSWQFCANNSSPQGQIFYQTITANAQPNNYNVYAVDACVGAEGVGGGFPEYGNGTLMGMQAIEYDMAGNAQQSIAAKCVH
jgi:hypothetical protein